MIDQQDKKTVRIFSAKACAAPLEKAVEFRDGWLVGHLNIDPRLKPLWEDDGFKEILKEIGLE